MTNVPTKITVTRKAETMFFTVSPLRQSATDSIMVFGNPLAHVSLQKKRGCAGETETDGDVATSDEAELPRQSSRLRRKRRMLLSFLNSERVEEMRVQDSIDLIWNPERERIRRRNS
jgi:hypothetical protein